MRTASEWFLALWVVALALWICAFVLHWKARGDYLGPTGLGMWRNPLSRYLFRNYTPTGATLVRWELICEGAFVIACLVGFAIAHTQFRVHR